MALRYFFLRCLVFYICPVHCGNKFRDSASPINHTKSLVRLQYPPAFTAPFTRRTPGVRVFVSPTARRNHTGARIRPFLWRHWRRWWPVVRMGPRCGANSGAGDYGHRSVGACLDDCCRCLLPLLPPSGLEGFTLLCHLPSSAQL